MLRKIQIFQKNVAQSTGNYVAQNTDFYENCSSKYNKKYLHLYCANYNLAKKMLRKVQILKTDFPQITVFSRFFFAFYSFRKIQKQINSFTQNTA